MRRDLAIRLILVLVALAIWLPGLDWGLPSRASDRHLFGDRTPWTGAEILALLGQNDADRPSRGADVDADPLLDRSRPIVLNDTDAKRAAIVQRYRLMSGQPDEFIQFKALAEMSQRSGWAKLDPRLYQYGGLWIYPVGGLVRAAMEVGLIERSPAGVSAQAFYLDRPEIFGRFYVIARAYSAGWGVVALLAVYRLARRMTSKSSLAAVATIAFILLPVVRTATHEAKPHLAGAALCLCATIAAGMYVERGRRRWLLVAGAVCGAAMGMVVSMVLSLVVLPMAVVVQRQRARLIENPLPRTRGRGQGEGVAAGAGRASGGPQDATPSPQPSPAGMGERGSDHRRSIAWATLASLATALLVYAASNPFVLYNAIANPELLRSNLGNSTAMYGVGGFQSVTDAVRIFSAGAGWSLLPLTVVGGGLLIGFRHGLGLIPASLWLILTIGAVVMIQFVALAAGKPAEYARFGIIPATACILLIAAVVGRCNRPMLKVACAIIGLGLCADLALSIPRDDKYARRAMVRNLDSVRSALDAGEAIRVGVYREPAPWSMPAVDLFRSEIVLLTPAVRDGVDVVIWPSNLAADLGRGRQLESLDWRQNVSAVDVDSDRVRAAASRPISGTIDR